MNVKPEREMQHHAPRGRRSEEAWWQILKFSHEPWSSVWRVSQLQKCLHECRSLVGVARPFLSLKRKQLWKLLLESFSKDKVFTWTTMFCVKAKEARECRHECGWLRVARTRLNGGAVTALDGEGVNWGDWSLSRRQLDTRAVNDLREVSQGPLLCCFHN